MQGSNKYVSPGTVNRDLAVLRRMMNLAVKRGYLESSPFSKVDLLEERRCRRQPHILTFEEQSEFMKAASESPLISVLVFLLTETGLRVCREALALKWTDISFKEQTLAVTQSKTFAAHANQADAGISEITISATDRTRTISRKRSSLV